MLRKITHGKAISGHDSCKDLLLAPSRPGAAGDGLSACENYFLKLFLVEIRSAAGHDLLDLAGLLSCDQSVS